MTLLETGFADLPEDAYQRVFEDNSAGWKSELEDLRAHLMEPAI